MIFLLIHATLFGSFNAFTLKQKSFCDYVFQDIIIYLFDALHSDPDSGNSSGSESDGVDDSVPASAAKV